MEIREIVVCTKKDAQKTHWDILPFGDLQVGSVLFDEGMWGKYVEAVKAARNPITIGMGDYADHFRPSVQERLTGAIKGYDKDSLRSIEDMHREFMDRKVLPKLRPVIEASSCLGLLGGHHDMDYSDGTNSTQHLCRELDVPYLGRGECMVRVVLMLSATNAHKALTFDLFATHGEGTGSSVGGPIRKLQQLLSYFDVDIALRGHSCDKFIFQEPQFIMTRSHPPRLRERNRIIANTGGFSRGRVEGELSYVEKANLVPKAMGWVEIHVHIKREPRPDKPRGQGTQYVAIGD